MNLSCWLVDTSSAEYSTNCIQSEMLLQIFRIQRSANIIRIGRSYYAFDSLTSHSFWTGLMFDIIMIIWCFKKWFDVWCNVFLWKKNNQIEFIEMFPAEMLNIYYLNAQNIIYFFYHSIRFAHNGDWCCLSCFGYFMLNDKEHVFIV